MVRPVARREAIAHLQAIMGLSELRGRRRELANERRRFGQRRLLILLRREVEPSGVNRIYRLDSKEELTVRKRWA